MPANLGILGRLSPYKLVGRGIGSGKASEITATRGGINMLNTTALQTGTLASPPETLYVGEAWLDTTGTGGDEDPILRIHLGA